MTKQLVTKQLLPEVNTTVSECVSRASDYLPESDSAKLDMEVLLCHVLSQTRTYLYTWPEAVLSVDQYQSLISLLEKRQQGQPVAHLIGLKEFWSLPLKVTSDTLIPRPDTEVLIEWVLEHFDQSSKHAVDLGTGTGAIALALASEYPQWSVWGSDRISKAVQLASENAQRLGLGRVSFFESSWFERFADCLPNQRFDLIISNPPYIAENDPHLSQGDVRFEPASALTAGVDGLDDVRLIADQATCYLVEGGCLIVEHGYDQAQLVADIFRQSGLKRVGSGKDYGGNDRFTFGWKE